MVENRPYDVVVLGGGSAGCVAAARLSEDPNRRVLLLESGPDEFPDVIADGSGQHIAVLQTGYVVMYPTTRRFDGSEYYPLSGRVLGGGSSVNMMGVSWPSQVDLDGWAALGNPGWTYQECLPYLRGIESDQDFGSRPNHGDSGPLHVVRHMRIDQRQPPPMQQIIDRAAGLGMPLQDDGNGPGRYGVAPSAWNIKDGIRQSTAVAYLGPARGRANLSVVGSATVMRLLLSGSRVTGVEYEHEGSLRTVRADRFVLSAGTYHSPQILMLSGIGPQDELARHGIAPAHVLEGVGANYQDHAAVNLMFEGNPDYHPDWAFARFSLSYKSDPSYPVGDFHIIPRSPIHVEGLKPLMPMMINLVEQRSRGRLRLASTDVNDLPVIDDGMLQDPGDIDAMVKAMHFVADFVDEESLRPYYRRMVAPGPDEAWADFARSTYDSHHHGSGTCKMGPASDPMAVVDARLKVHGLDNLHIADASIFPVVPHAATNISAILTGERLAAFINEAGG